MINLDDYLMGRDKDYPLTDDLLDNAFDLVGKLNTLQDEYGLKLIITSGYRPPEINKSIRNAIQGDAHEKCQGVDLRDTDRALSDWCLANLETLIDIGFWMESPVSAKNHVHLQTYAPHSGKRIFLA